MRLLFLILALLFFKVGFTQTTSFKVLDKKDYSIAYHAEFLVDETGSRGPALVFQIPDEDSADHFSSNINLVIQDLSTLDYDLDKFVELTENQVKSVLTVLETKRVKDEGKEFHSLIFEGTLNGLDLKFLQYDFVKNKRAYVLTYIARTDQFDKNLPEVKKTMDSFTLK